MNLAQMRARLRELMTRAVELRDKSDRNDDDEAEITKLLAEINDLGPQIKREEALVAAADGLRSLTEPATGAAGAQGPLAGVGGERTAAALELLSGPRTIGAEVIRSEEFKRFSRTPKGTSQRIDIGQLITIEDGTVSPFSEQRAELDKLGAADLPPELRALVYTAGFASYIRPTRLPGVSPFIRRALRVRDLFVNIPIQTTGYDFVRMLAGTNAAAEVAEATTVGGATAKPEAAINLEVVTGTTATIAAWVPVTRQMLEDDAQIRAIIDNELLTFLDERIDSQLLLGDGVGANLKGLENETGVQNLDAAYFAGAAVVDTGVNNQNTNRIRRAIRTIATSTNGRGTANFVILNPADAERFDTYTDANKQYLFGGPAAGGIRTLWGLAVVESEVQTAGVAFVGDSRWARVVVRSEGQIYMTDSHSDWFTKNLFAILAEARIGQQMVRPSAFAKVALAADV